jgi:uncharacterized protein YdaU (DUF1376 family)
MAPQKPPAFQFYAKDFIAGTATMSLQEVGAYVRLLCHQWDAGFVPSDPKERSRICACSLKQESELWRKVGKKFAPHDDVFVNERLEAERQKQAEYRRKQSDNGKASAAARANGGSTEPPTMVEPSHQPNVNSSSSSSSSVPTSKDDVGPTPRPLTAKRNLSAEYEHPRFDVPTSWHLRTAKGLSNGESRLLKFYGWLAARVDRTNEDTLPRFEWLDRCFKEWLEAAQERRLEVPVDTRHAQTLRDIQSGKYA